MYLVCGEALYDFFVEEEDELGGLSLKAMVGGSPYNVSMGIARLGVPSALFTSISGDMLGERLVARMNTENVDTTYLRRSGRRTTVSMVGLDTSGHPAYVFYGTGSADCNINLTDLPELGPEITGLHFGSYSVVVEPAASSLLTLGRRHQDRLISFDPNVRLNVEGDIEVWRRRVSEYAEIASLIKISAEDFALVYPDGLLDSKVQEWISRGVRMVIVTDGGKAVKAWTSNGLFAEVTPASIDVVDTVGAGDSFQSALLMSLWRLGKGIPLSALDTLTEMKLIEVLEFCSKAAAVTCTRRGADLPRHIDISTQSR